MNSRIYTGHIAHARLHRADHSFRHPVYFVAVDLDELDGLDANCRLFGHNRLRPLALWDSDYLHRGNGSIREKLMHHLRENGCGEGVERVTLVTTPRYLNYAFNPVSFHYCWRGDGSLGCVVAEVNNTFGERHLYIPTSEGPPPPDGLLTRLVARKEFHVSPFNDMEGRYEFLLSPVADRIDIRVNLWRGEELAFTSQLAGDAMPFTDANLARTLVRFPVSTLKTMPRILVQAAKLHWGRKLPVHAKPVPVSPMTIRTRSPGIAERFAMRVVRRALSRLRRGTLTLELPGGGEWVFGGAFPGRQATVKVRDPHFFTRLVTAGDVGLGEGYTAGDWDSEDLASVVAVFAQNMGAFDDRSVVWTRLARLANRLGHLRRPNSQRGSRRNIRAHYDLGNSFYEQFLDKSMTYSCAIYDKPADTLESAQENKIATMIRKARIGHGDHVLEIGSGWGSFAIEAVRRTGCRVTTVTLSEAQLAVVRARAAEAGLADRIEARLCDYRDLEGAYDKIVSIEMLEAVGHRYLGSFFKKCDSLLKHGGVMALQVITIPDQRYDAYRKGCDWVQKHIFPGGFVPSLTAILEALRDHSDFVVYNVDNIGMDYAKTLREWSRRFSENSDAIRQLGFGEQFQRMWRYYLAYCEAGFDTGALGTLQIVLGRPESSRRMAQMEQA